MLLFNVKKSVVQDTPILLLPIQFNHSYHIARTEVRNVPIPTSRCSLCTHQPLQESACTSGGHFENQHADRPQHQPLPNKPSKQIPPSTHDVLKKNSSGMCRNRDVQGSCMQQIGGYIVSGLAQRKTNSPYALAPNYVLEVHWQPTGRENQGCVGSMVQYPHH